MLLQIFVHACSLMMHRELRMRLNLIKPNITTNVHGKQANQKQ